MLLRTYHNCLVFHDDVLNAHTMIYKFFTWGDMRRDVAQYVRKYQNCMERGNNTVIVAYGDEEVNLTLLYKMDVENVIKSETS